MIQLTTSAIVLLFSLFSLFFVFPDAYAQSQPSVSSVTLHQEGDGRERVRIKLEGAHEPKVYTLDGENPRLICDFPGAGYAGLVKPVVKGGGTLVTRIRVGAHDPPARKVRVVLDIEPGRKYTYTREFSKEENILNILLVPTGPAKKTEKAVTVIEATEAKQVVITGPKKIYRTQGDQKTPPAAEPAVAGQTEADQPETGSPAATEASAPAPETVDTPAAAAVEPEAGADAEAAGKAAQTTTPAPAAQEKEEVAAVAVPKAEPAPEPATPAPDAAGSEKASGAAVQPAAQEPAADAPAGEPEAVTAAAPVEAEKAAGGEESGKQADAAVAESAEKAAEPESAEEKPQAAPAGQPDAGAVPQLLEISYENSSSKGEMIFFRLNGFYPPSVTADESETPKVNCEFTGMELGPDVQRTIEARGAYVQKVATTADKKGGKVRVDIDLTPDRDYDLRQVFFKEDNLFVLIVNTLDEESVGSAGDAGADAAPEPGAEAAGK